MGGFVRGLEERETAAVVDVEECKIQEQGATFNAFRAKLNREQASCAFFLERRKEFDATTLALATQVCRALASSELLCLGRGSLFSTEVQSSG